MFPIRDISADRDPRAPVIIPSVAANIPSVAANAPAVTIYELPHVGHACLASVA
jgi:hypothetical protein